jgi:hypothetical protein
METLFIEASSIECSEERREISGKIVPLGTGEVGHTNLGAYTFAANSIEIADPSKIKLLSETNSFSKLITLNKLKFIKNMKVSLIKIDIEIEIVRILIIVTVSLSTT